MSENIDYKFLWAETVAKVKSEIGEKDFNRWFKLEFAGASKNTIILATSPLVVDQINNRYPGILENSLQNQAAGFSIKFVFNEPVIENPNEQNVKTSLTKKTTQPIANVRESPNIKTKMSCFLDEYTFTNYVIGENNEFAVNAAQVVAQNPGVNISYNPLFIYGGVGLGKTHLIQAIGNYINENSDHKVVYTSCEEFFNEFIACINVDKSLMKNFKRKYRESDILIVDDIHFLEGKERAQEELFNTFNALYKSKKQMVFTCDRPAIELKKIAERLRTRLGSGISIDIKIPKYETRYAILNKKIETMKTELTKDIIDLICKNIKTNIRDMVSALNKLNGYQKLTNKKITLEIAQDLLKDIFASPYQTNITIESIIHIISFQFGLTINDIKGKSRKKNIVYPRQLAMYIARQITTFTVSEIGNVFNRDHSTVLHSIDAIEERKLNNPHEESYINDLINTIKEQSIK